LRSELSAAPSEAVNPVRFRAQRRATATISANIDQVKAKWWHVFLAGVCLTLVGLCMVGVGLVGLGVADQLASVGAFVLTGIGTVLAVISLVVGLRQQRSPVPPVPAEPPRPAPATGPPPLAADLARLRDVTNVDHERLFGVDDELDRLGESLRNPDGAALISIFGGAGVGKTALAYELIRRHAAEAGFHRVASVSAKFSHIDRIGHLERDAERESIDWHALLVELAQQLAPGMDFNDVLIEQQLPRAMPAAPCLILVDNLETNEAEVAVRYLAGSGILGPHKVVITTREAVAGTGVGRLREVTWDGPDHAAAADYARYLAEDDRLLDPRKSDLDDVVRAAERTPLLIQIIINQARVERLPIREVITRLRDVSGNLGKAVWTYCYVNSLNVLEQKLRDPELPENIGREQAADTVADLMAVFCARPAGTSIASDDFFRLSRIGDHEVFLRARAMACRLALVKSLKNNERFTVHSLLREFYCAQRGECSPS
jgi:hypothetical protein